MGLYGLLEPKADSNKDAQREPPRSQTQSRNAAILAVFSRANATNPGLGRGLAGGQRAKVRWLCR